MPSGYTAGIQNGTINNLNDFIWTCARGFGAFITQKDNIDEPPILKEKPNPYYKNKIKQLLNEQQKYNEYTEDDWQNEYLKYIEDQLKDIDDNIKEKIESKEKYENILNQVKEWIPPNENFHKLKSFMINQIEESIDFDCDTSFWQERKNKISNLKLEQYKRNVLNDINESLISNKEYYDEEVQRVKERNQWKQQLVDSVGLPKILQEKNHEELC
jgi:gas vesicle protein